MRPVIVQKEMALGMKNNPSHGHQTDIALGISEGSRGALSLLSFSLSTLNF